MRILYYDCFCGISGDMNLGAMIDLGVDSEYLKRELGKLPMAHEFELQVSKAVKKGIEGTKADVLLKHTHSHDNHGAHSHENHHQHSHEAPHTHQHSHSHEAHVHRNLAMIESMINNSTLSDSVKALSLKIFMEVAIAEAKVHGKPIQEVHFHEVGAVDSIVDIVGAAICYEALGVDRVKSSSVQLGGGFVKCEHGMMPVPAPATAEILKGVPVKIGLVASEMTTPTGAAILKALVHEYTDQLNLNITKIGYGLGTREHEFPNVLRVMLVDTSESIETEKQQIVETNLDDFDPEIWHWVEQKLFDAGALDIWRQNIAMKKGRMGTCLSVLCTKAQQSAIEAVILCETTAIGLRTYEVEKTALERDIVTFGYENETLSVKCVYWQGKPLKYKVEYEDLVLLAKKRGEALITVQKAIYAFLEEQERWKYLSNS